MSEKARALPSWMSKKVKEKVKEKEAPRSRRNRKTARSAFYCMNEKELLEAAVLYLSEDAALRGDRKVKDKSVNATVKMTENPASSKPVKEASEDESSDCCDAQDTTYVSETDLDVSELETVPYTKSGPDEDQEEVQRSGQVQEPEAERRKERSEMHADAGEEEDDALRLVREIFFT